MEENKNLIDKDSILVTSSQYEKAEKILTRYRDMEALSSLFTHAVISDSNKLNLTIYVKQSLKICILPDGSAHS